MNFRYIKLTCSLLIFSFSSLASSYEQHMKMQDELARAALSSKYKAFSSRTIFPLQNGTIKNVAKNTIFITIDDGPFKEATPLILKTLREYDIQATFFVVGRQAIKYQSIIREAASDGHVIANHSFRHEQDFPTAKKFYDSILRTDDIIKHYPNNTGIMLFRAPFGVWNSWRKRHADRNARVNQYVGPIFWNVGGGVRGRNNDADWKCWDRGVSPQNCANSYLSQIYRNYKKGAPSLVLFHDVSPNSAKLIEIVVRTLINDRIAWNFKLVDDIPIVQEMSR